jgi:hypothetical protein
MIKIKEPEVRIDPLVLAVDDLNDDLCEELMELNVTLKKIAYYLEFVAANNGMG